MLNLANTVVRWVWRCQSPLYYMLLQFPNVLEIVCHRLECKTDMEWLCYTCLTVRNMGGLVGVPKMGHMLRKLVQWFPQLELLAHAQPVLQTTMWVELTLTLDFEYDVDVQGCL